MKKIILLFVAFVFFQNVNAQCPSYAAAPSSPAEACSDQPLYFNIENTLCPGTINFTVTGSSGNNGAQISWEIINIATGTSVASGGQLPGPPTSVGSGGVSYGNNTAINVPLTLDPTNGTSFMLYIYDAVGNGFAGAGNITISSGISPTVSITSAEFSGSQTNSGFSGLFVVDNVNYSITTSAGTVTGVLTSCADLNSTLTFTNPSFCSTSTEDVTWSLSCASDGSILSAGTQSITVYPSLPTSAADLVDIAWDEPTCSYIVTPTDCAVGTVFTISPDPTTLPAAPYTAAGTETFTVTYTGPAGGPSCCATGGPAVPYTYVVPAPTTSAVATNSPFNTPAQAPANAAYLTTGPSSTGGTAVSGSFTVNVAGYSFPNPCGTALDDYWVTIYVDGTVISDQNFPAGPTSVTIDLAAISAAGVTFDEGSVIEAYVYPNTFGNATCFSTFVPGGPAVAEGEWTATTIEISAVLFEFTELVPSPANCDFTADVAYTACPVCAISAAVSNVVCDDNGTATDPSDDTYTFDLTVTDDGGTGTTWSGNGQTAAAYGTPVAMGPYPISGGDIAISVAEDADALCTATATATAPAACSVPTLTISITDPCNCSTGLDLNSDGTNEYAQEVITLTSSALPNITAVTGLFDAAGVAMTTAAANAALVDNLDGTWSLTAYVPADATSTYTLDAMNGPVTATIAGGPCLACPGPGCTPNNGTPSITTP